jgi:hypothetical protein
VAVTLAQSEQLLKGQTPSNVDPDDAKELVNYRDAFSLVADYVSIQRIQQPGTGTISLNRYYERLYHVQSYHRLTLKT